MLCCYGSKDGEYNQVQVVRCRRHFLLAVHVWSVCDGLGRETGGPCAYYLMIKTCMLGFSEAVHYIYNAGLICYPNATLARTRGPGALEPVSSGLSQIQENTLCACLRYIN